MLGGGSFTGFTKILPGVYDRFKSAEKQEETSTKGYVAMAKELSFGDCQKIITAKKSTIEDDCMKLFGYSYSDSNMLWLRECFTGGANIVYVYNLLTAGTKASNDYAEAKYSGTISNSLKITIEEQTDDTYEVITYMGTDIVDDQIGITQVSDIKDNDYVSFKSTMTLGEVSQEALASGTNGTASGTGHEDFLKLCESIYTNIILCTATDTTTTALYTEYEKTLIEQVGNKTQMLLYRTSADYFGTVNLYSKTSGSLGDSGFLYWLAGAESAVKDNESLTNKKYDGELELGETLSQTQLTNCVKGGQLCFHMVGDEIRVLEDINSFVTFTDDYNSDFANNQHVRIIFSVLIAQGTIYKEKHLGKTQLDSLGVGLAYIYNDMLDVLKDFYMNGCLELPSGDDVKVSKVDKKSVYMKEWFETVVATDKFYIDGIVA